MQRALNDEENLTTQYYIVPSQETDHCPHSLREQIVNIKITNNRHPLHSGAMRSYLTTCLPLCSIYEEWRLCILIKKKKWTRPDCCRDWAGKVWLKIWAKIERLLTSFFQFCLDGSSKLFNIWGGERNILYFYFIEIPCYNWMIYKHKNAIRKLNVICHLLLPWESLLERKDKL